MKKNPRPDSGLNKIQRRNRFFAAAALLMLLVFATAVNPHEVQTTSCRFLDITGYPCPTCGISRSLFFTARLDLATAFSFHPLGIPLYVTLIVLIIKSLSEAIAGRNIWPKPGSNQAKRVLWITALLWFSIWLLRLINI